MITQTKLGVVVSLTEAGAEEVEAVVEIPATLVVTKVVANVKDVAQYGAKAAMWLCLMVGHLIRNVVAISKECHQAFQALTQLVVLLMPILNVSEGSSKPVVRVAVSKAVAVGKGRIIRVSNSLITFDGSLKPCHLSSECKTPAIFSVTWIDGSPTLVKASY